MRILTTILVCLCLIAGAALAASIDGKWVSERKMERNGQSFTTIQTFNLKSEGNKLTGSISMAFGDQEPRIVDISDGKIEGHKFSFHTVVNTPNGEMKIVYEGSVDGDTMKGNTSRDGQRRPFEAKRK